MSRIYKGVLVERVFPSGYYTFRDPHTGQFWRMDDWRKVKDHISKAVTAVKKEVN